METLKSKFLSVEIKKRASAFVWHTGMMVLAFAVDQSLTNLGMLHLPESVTLLGIAFNPTIVAGLVLGQVSKLIRNRIVVSQDNQG